ncbi:alpha/beta fold hydrolase [Marinimicrobium agarilyticum]|uniref:alpha/beta fold hydrolase n=1 Tax=Marinimicrobium agarilyticum TaxID=306546 RepID=UPI0004036ABD|nr:alpha/beta hydrolase [Marinimicrobium agarilyticum]
MTIRNYRQALIDKIEAPVTQSNVMAGSVETAYLSSGAGPVLICLHGAGAGAVTWYPSIGALSKHFHVVAPDIVGYGESDKPDASYDRAYFAKWLKDFLSALGIAKAHVVGLSQGGAIALQFVLDNPKMVDKLILVDSGALGAQPSLASFLGMLWLNSIPSSLANRFYSRYILFDPDNRDPNHARYSVQVLKSKGGKNAFRQGKGAAVSKMPEDSLRQIENESLILWGEDDQLFAIEYGEAAARILPNARFYRISNAGHLPLMDQPATFNQAVLNFLKGSRK